MLPVTSLFHKRKMPPAVAFQERVYGIIPGVASFYVNSVYQKSEQHNNLVLQSLGLDYSTSMVHDIFPIITVFYLKKKWEPGSGGARL